MAQQETHSTSSAIECSSYEIRIQGELDERWSDWFASSEITIEHSGAQSPLTLLKCPSIDQTKLRGILNKIWDMNLTLVSLREIAGPAQQEKPQQGSEGPG